MTLLGKTVFYKSNKYPLLKDGFRKLGLGEVMKCNNQFEIQGGFYRKQFSAYRVSILKERY